MLARRALLSQRNPLGLIYTLFADADLALRSPPLLSPILTTAAHSVDPKIEETENAVLINGLTIPKRQS